MASLFWLVVTQNRIKNNELGVSFICLQCMVLIHLQTFRWLPHLAYCKHCCNIHRGAYIFSHQCFFFFRKIPKTGIAELYGGIFGIFQPEIIWCFYYFEEIKICFSKWLYQFASPSKMHEYSLFVTSSPLFVICCLFDKYSDRCEVISH